MDKSMRNILIILGVFCLLSLVTAVKFFQIERATYRQYLQIESENVKLSEEMSSLNQEKSKLTTELVAAKKELKEISKKEKELRREYDSIVDERKELNLQVGTLTREKEESEKKISEMGSGSFLSRLLKEKVSLQVKVKNLEEKLKKTNELEKEIEVAVKERAELREQLLEEKEVSEHLSKYFLKEKQEKTAALNKLQETEKKLVKLKKELKVFQKKREKLAVDISDMETVSTEKVPQVDLLRPKEEKAIKEPEPTAEKIVELPPIIVKMGSPTHVSSPVLAPVQPERIVSRQVALPKGLEGEIMTVNEEHRFVVIDLGSDDGLKIGMVFIVHRGKKEIARIRVVGTRKQIAAADIINFERRMRIRVGDIVSSEPR